MKPEELHHRLKASAVALAGGAVVFGAIALLAPIDAVRYAAVGILTLIAITCAAVIHQSGRPFLDAMNEAVTRARGDLLTTARHQKTLTERLEKLNLVSDLLKSVAGSRDLDSLLGTILAKTMQFVGCRSGFVSLLNDETLNLEVVSTVALDGHPVEPGLIRLGEGLIGEVALSNTPKLISPGDSRSYGNGNQTLMAVPLRIDDRVIGVLTLEESQHGEFRQSDLELLDIVGQEIGLAIEKARLYKRMEEMSITDPLTGLANRRYMDQRLVEDVRRSRRYHLSLAATIFDLDHFKQVNDTHGHAAGDSVLRQFAEILKSNSRDTDLVARFGGEEFVIIMPDCTEQQAHQIAERIRLAVANYQFSVPGGSKIKRTVSCGVATIPLDAGDAPSLLDASDMALYHAKANGRNRVVLRQELSQTAVSN